MVFDDDDDVEEGDEDDDNDEESAADDDDDEDVDEEDEEYGDEGSDADESEEEEEEENGMIVGAARWKKNIANKAKDSFIQRQLNAKNLHSVRIFRIVRLNKLQIEIYPNYTDDYSRVLFGSFFLIRDITICQHHFLQLLFVCVLQTDTYFIK